jgi:hypothetical protein
MALSVSVACVTVTTAKDTLPAFVGIPDIDTVPTAGGHEHAR